MIRISTRLIVQVNIHNKKESKRFNSTLLEYQFTTTSIKKTGITETYSFIILSLN